MADDAAQIRKEIEAARARLELDIEQLAPIVSERLRRARRRMVSITVIAVALAILVPVLKLTLRRERPKPKPDLLSRILAALDGR